MLWYSLVGSDGKATPADVIDPGFMPREGEWARQGGPDKFLGSNLEEKLKARGIRTVIVCGTSFQGVGVGTGSGSAQRGYKVVVVVDGMAGNSPFAEAFTATQLTVGPTISSNVTLTRSGTVKF